MGFGPPALIESDHASQPLFPWQAALVEKMMPPAVSAEAFVIMDGTTGRVLVERDAHRRVAVASLTKIATAITAIETGRLSDRVVVDVHWQDLLDSSVMGLTPGEELTLEDLLYGLLLPSGNDAAVAIARHIGGSVPQFVAKMNEKTWQLGLQNTHFVNPHGLDAQANYSSPYDITVLARHAMTNPTFASIVGTREIRIQTAEGIYPLENVNRLLGSYAEVDGVKTGYTDQAKQAVVVSAKRDGLRVFVTVTRSEDYRRDARLLLDYFFENFAGTELTLPKVPEGFSPGGARRPSLLPIMTMAAPRWQRPYLDSSVWLDPSREVGRQLGGGKATLAGWAFFRLGSELVAQRPLYLD